MRFILGLGFLLCGSLLVGCGSSSAVKADTTPLILSAAYDTQTPEPKLMQVIAELQRSVATIETRMDQWDEKFKTLKLDPEQDIAPAKPAQQTAHHTTKTEPTHKQGVYAVRLGTHPDRVRIVLDMSRAPKAQVTLDETENLLSIVLSGDAWNAPEQATYKNTQAIVSGYQVTQDEDTVTLVFALKEKTKIIGQGALKNPDRLMIDLSR